jgi:type II secretory pathway component PulF
MKLAYQGYDLTGKSATGIIDAPTRPEAAEQLRKQGILATRIDELDAAITDIASGATAGVSFSRQLSILVSTKTPLVQAMAAVERQTPQGPWRDILAAVRLKVEEGRRKVKQGNEK